MTDYTVTYAQNREDIIIAGFFPAGYCGFYVDVGANDPVKDSVTNYFYRLGWRGMNIEPIERHYKNLCTQRPRDINLKTGVGTKAGELAFREYAGDGLSTFSNNMKKQYERGAEDGNTAKYKDYIVQIKKLEDIFLQYSVTNIDFIKIDVEGYEYDVIVSNNWKKYRPKVICIEANHINKDWRPVLRDNGYILKFFDGLNEYYVDKTIKSLLSFDYVKAVIGINYIRNDVFRELHYVQKDIQRLKQENSELYERITYLDAHIYEQSRLKNMIKSLIRKVHTIALLYLTKSFRGKKRYPKISEADFSSSESMISVIHQADVKAFNTKLSLGARSRIVLAKGVYIMYRAAARSMFLALKHLKRLVRQSKKRDKTL